MSYINVTGDSDVNNLDFVGIAGAPPASITNPYTGYTITLSGTRFLNNGIYDGKEEPDSIFFSGNSDILKLVDDNGTITVKNVETFSLQNGNDVLILADENQSYGDVFAYGGNGNDVIWLNDGNDYVWAGPDNDIIDGGRGNDRLMGEDGNDYLNGGLGIDTLAGGAGDDILIYTADAVWAGGHTLADFSSAIPFASAVALDGKNQTYDSFHGDGDFSLAVTTQGIDTLEMTSGNDVFILNDTLSPSSGLMTARAAYVEIVNAGGGDDVVDFSGAPYGAIIINGGAGNDVLGGNSGADTINGDAGNDKIYGGGGNDTLSGGTGDDVYYYNAGDGSDTITDTAGSDSIVLGSGIILSALTFTVSGNDLLIGVGSDTLTLKNQMGVDSAARVETLVFSDGSTYSLTDFIDNIDPVAKNDTFNGQEDVILTGNVLTNDTDENNDTLTVTPAILTTAMGGTLTLHADGSFSYLGAADFNGVDGFTYTVTDGHGGTDTAFATLNIAPVNDGPVAGADTATGDEDTVITGTLLANDTDIDSNPPLTATAETLTSAHGATVTINADGTFSYLGAANFNGDDTFFYTANDADGGTGQGKVTVHVMPVNDNPTANDDSFSGKEDEIVTGNILTNDKDVDGDTLSVTAVTLTTAQGGAVTLNADGTFTYLGAAGFKGADSFTYTLNDTAGGTATGNVGLTITAVNHAPVAHDDSFNGVQDQPVTGNLLLNDTDQDGNTLSTQAAVITTAQGGSVTINADGTFSYLGATGFFGADSFTYTTNDGQGASSSANVGLTIAAANHVPEAGDDLFSGDEDVEIKGNVLNNDTDLDHDALTVIAGTFTTAQGGTLTLQADGSFSYLGKENYFGLDSFSYTVQDGRGGTDTGMATLKLNPINDAPFGEDDAYAAPGGYVLANVLDNDTDIDGDQLYVADPVSISDNGVEVHFNPNGLFEYQATDIFTGIDHFFYTVIDGMGGQWSAIVTIDLDGSGTIIVNNDPVANNDIFSGKEDEIITGNILANDTDIDGDTLFATVRDVTTANGGHVSINMDGTFTYLGAENFHGTDTFTYDITDGQGGGSTASVTLTVESVNDQPVGKNDTFTGDEDQPVTGNVLTNDTDADNDTLTATAGTFATLEGGSVTINTDGTFSYLGAANFHGTDSFTYTVNDAFGGTATANAVLTIGSVNDKPSGVDDAFSGSEDQSVTGNVLTNDTDADNDALTATAGTFTTLQGGSVTINVDGTFSYLGATGFHGTDGFTYTVTDSAGASSIANVVLNIGAVNHAPVAAADSFSGDEDQPITGNVLTNDTDTAGDTLTAVAATLTTAQGGSVTLNADGTFSYHGATNFNGNDSFVYAVTDLAGLQSTAEVSLTIKPVNDAPVAADDSFNGLHNAALTGNVLLANGSGPDSDIDGDTLSVEPATITTAQGGTVTLLANGFFTYTPATGFYGADHFDYVLKDGHGGQDTGGVDLTIALDPSKAIIGTENGETIDGTSGNNEIFALDGNDTVKGEDGDDTIYGGAGDDTLYGDDSILNGGVKEKTFSVTTAVPNMVDGVSIYKDNPNAAALLGIAHGDLSVDYAATATVTFRSGNAGYDSSFGVFGIAADGTITNEVMNWANVKTAGVNVEHDIALPVGTSGGDYGFFIISNGSKVNNGYAGLDVTGAGKLSFIYNYGQPDAREAKITDAGNKISAVYNDGTTVKVLAGDVFFTTERDAASTLNKDAKSHVISGLADTNNLAFDAKNITTLNAKPTSTTEDGITLTALQGYLAGGGDKVGIASSAAGGNLIMGNESMRIGLASGADKVLINFSDIEGKGTGMDFKIYMNGDMTHAISYEFALGNVASKMQIVLDASMFGSGVITAVDVSSIADSALGTESFYINKVAAMIPGGTDSSHLRIGFEDLNNLGDSDYEDVLFDLHVKPQTLADTGGNDIIDGGAGNDTLYGEGGNDILFFGAGADHLYGGAGADTFAVTAIDANADTIHDFNHAQGDVINIAAVLEAFDPLNDDIANFVHLVQNGGNTEIQINADGHAGGAFVTAAIVLGGVGSDSLDTLIANGSLVADHKALA